MENNPESNIVRFRKGIYRHNSEGLFYVDRIARDSETAENFMIFRKINEEDWTLENQLCAISEHEFYEKIELNDGKIVARFTYIDDE